VQDVLERCLVEKSFFAQLAAAKALGTLGRGAATAALQRLIDSDVDGRLAKVARQSLDRITTNESPEAWNTLREEVAGLRRENRDLRGRIERLEGRVLPGQPGTKRPQAARRQRAQR
jgi:hypothetical protein